MSATATPAVSFVLPFRNAATTLHEALDSIAAQSLADFECVLVDHDSHDGSAELARDFAAQDRRFLIVGSGGSFVDALNLGVRQSRAPLIARMDADDLAHPMRLEAQVAELREFDLDLVSCLVDCFPRSELAGGMRRYEDWINGIVSEDEIRAALFVESPLPHPTTLFRRAVFDRAGGYLDTDGPEDYDLWLRMLLGGARAQKVARPLLRWRDSPARLSRTDPRYGKDRFFATKLRHFANAVPRSLPLQLWGAGPTGRRWLRRLRQQGYEIGRIVDSIERQIGRTVQGMTVEPPAALRREDGLIIAAVGLLGARAIMEEELRERDFHPLRDYIAVA